MPSHRFQNGFAARLLGRRWWTVLCALAVALFAPRSALAAGMCDPSGMSVVAPIPALPSVTGEFSAQKNCESPQDEMNVGHSHRQVPQVKNAPDAPPRIVVAVPSLPRLPGRPVATPEAARMPNRPGFASPVYRPPRVSLA
jgi:hypothetical protein